MIAKTTKQVRTGKTRMLFRKKTARKTPVQITGQKEKLKIIPLGGLEEVGRNMILFEYGRDIIIVDMGLQFPEEDMPGIDYVIPNISYLKDKIKNIRGVIITHGHYDHIGAIPHLMPRLGNPAIFTARLTAGIIRKRQEEHQNLPKLNIQEVNEHSRIKLGVFNLEFFHLNHNIPDSFGLFIKTPVGNLVHTGDFKLDYNPVYEKPADLNRIAQIGNSGILALMCDSTDAEEPGHQISEKEVGIELEKIFEQAPGRIIIGTFASLLSRVQQIFWIAEKLGKKIMVEGRSMKTNVEIAHELGYLKFKPETLVDEKNFREVPENKLIVLCTGAQGERHAVLMRIANNEHRFIFFKTKDTVIFSSSVVPGNERTVQNLKDTIYKHDARVIHYQMMDIHAGGHAKQEDLKMMIRLVKPQFYIPIEGNHYMLRINGDLGKAVGVPENNIIIGENGRIIECQKNSCKLTAKTVPADYVFVDGLGVGDVSQIVLRDRQMMAADGMLVVIATIYKKTGALVQNPDLISRGFVYLKENKKLIEQIRSKAKKIMHDSDTKSPAFESYIKDKIRNDIGQFIYSKTKRRPMILPVLIEV
ncbi:ribonuclease J [Candidatus Parcubacteria bacterium]|nr:MAG: ribonuclease J [Candidatus Parcubacteria bacterium]